ncbi:MAG: hypothetical protein AAFX99_30325, partial [Myxococcota bacterium]
MSHHHRHSPQGRSPSPNTLLLFAVLTCIGIMALVGLGWLLFMQPSPKPISLEVTSAPPPSEPPPDAVETLEPVALLPAPTVRTPQEETDPCAPQAARVCLQGDVWWLDGCDRVEAKAEECGAQLCIEGNCEQPDPDGCTTSLYGRCVGDVVETCVGGRTVTVDCGAQGLRCGVGAEGAQCIAPTEQACTWPPGETACDGNRLLFCRDGELQEIDCEALGAVCDALGERGFRCLAEVTTWPEPPSQEEEESCGACGCPPSEPGPEVCDGLDNDGNQLIDDGALCAPVDIVAFVVTDRLGHGSYSEEDIAAELVRTNIVFAQGGHGLEITFRLAATVALRRPEWLELDDTDWDTLLRSGVLQGVQPDFYIPMVFTDRVLLGGTPKLGAATLPNGSCGGIRLHPRAQGALGAIALAKGRAPTTAAHELGHFLGLCHTHANTLDTAQSVLSDASGDTWVSSDCEVCANEGDGICDTPYDPGPPQCTYNQQCQTICSDGATVALNVHADRPRYTIAQPCARLAGVGAAFGATGPRLVLRGGRAGHRRRAAGFGRLAGTGVMEASVPPATQRQRSANLCRLLEGEGTAAGGVVAHDVPGIGGGPIA